MLGLYMNLGIIAIHICFFFFWKLNGVGVSFKIYNKLSCMEFLISHSILKSSYIQSLSSSKIKIHHKVSPTESRKAIFYLLTRVHLWYLDSSKLSMYCVISYSILHFLCVRSMSLPYLGIFRCTCIQVLMHQQFCSLSSCHLNAILYRNVVKCHCVHCLGVLVGQLDRPVIMNAATGFLFLHLMGLPEQWLSLSADFY